MRKAVLASLQWVVLFACVSAAEATTMYRWVDEAGVTHFSDKVPEKYKASARTVESRSYELSERERRQAADEAGRLLRSATPVPPASAPKGSSGASASSRTQVPTKAVDECEALWQTYYNAVACWDQGPKTRSGNPNMAYKRTCPDVTDPTSRCGTPRLRPQDRVADHPVFAPGEQGRWGSRNAP